MAKQYLRITSEPEMTEGKKEWTFRYKIPAMGDTPAHWDKRQKTGTKKKSEARRIAEDYRRDLEARINSWESWDRITLGEYAQRWHDGRRGKVAEGTWKKDGQAVGQIEKSELGALWIDELEPEDIERQAAENRRAGWSEDKNARFLKMVKRITKTAAERRRIQHDPGAPVENIRAKETERQAVPRAKIAEMMAKLEEGEKTSYTTALYIAMGTGMRRGEILGLTWGNVDFDRNLIHVRQQYTKQGTITPPKWNSVRIVPMTWELREWLKEWRGISTGYKGNSTTRKGTRLYSAPVCISNGGGWIDADNFNRWLRRLAAKEKWGEADDEGAWKGYTLHQVRHYMASELVSNPEIDLQTVRAIMGHRSITTTMKYLHAIDDNLYFAIEALAGQQKRRGRAQKPSSELPTP